MKNFFVIFNAVVFANLCTLVLYETYLTFKAETRQQAEYAEIAAENENQQLMDNSTADIAAAKAAETAAAASQASETLRKVERLCHYWEAQYKKEPTGLNKSLMNKACTKYRKLQPTTPSAE